MKLTLHNAQGIFVAHVTLPKRLGLPDVVMYDDEPYLRVSEDTYKYSASFFVARSKKTTLNITRRFGEPHTFEARSIYWYNGRTGLVKMHLVVPLDLPGRISQTITIDKDEVISLNVWCEPFGKQGHEARRITNEFCNAGRPKGSRLIVQATAIDDRGRMICDIQKQVPAFGQFPAQNSWLRAHLLTSPYFEELVWRMV